MIPEAAGNTNEDKPNDEGKAVEISTEAIEAGARALAADEGFELDDHQTGDAYRAVSRSVLTAAAPHMHAPVIELSDELATSAVTGDSYLIGRGSGFRIAGTRIRQVLGLDK